MTLTYISCSSDFDTIYVDVPDLLNYKAYNYQTLHSASPRYTDSAGTLTRRPWPIFCAPVTLTHFASTFDISSTIRPTTIKPYKVLLLNVLTWQIPWLSEIDLYFGWSSFDLIYISVPDLKCKTSNHQTLHSASPRCTDSAGILTRRPWPIFWAPVPFTHFTSMFNISSTIRPTTTKPCIIAWCFSSMYRLCRYLDSVTLTYISCSIDFYTFYVTLPYASTIRPPTTKPCIVLLLDVLTRQVPWPGDLDLYFALQWLWHIFLWCSISLQIQYKTYNHLTLHSASSHCTGLADTCNLT